MEEKDEVISLYDEDGIQTDFIVIDGVEYNEKTYLMLIEAENADDEESEALILRVDEDEDEDILGSVDDEEEFNAVAALFEEHYDENDEYEVQAGELDMDEE